MHIAQATITSFSELVSASASRLEDSASVTNAISTMLGDWVVLQSCLESCREDGTYCAQSASVTVWQC